MGANHHLTGIHELESGMVCFDNVGMRGRKGFAAKLPQLQEDMREIGEASSQTDPPFCTTQLYRRLTAAEAKRQLLEKGYNENNLPSERSLLSSEAHFLWYLSARDS